jgi:hypothetical protein
LISAEAKSRFAGSTGGVVVKGSAFFKVLVALFFYLCEGGARGFLWLLFAPRFARCKQRRKRGRAQAGKERAGGLSQSWEGVGALDTEGNQQNQPALSLCAARVCVIVVRSARWTKSGASAPHF